MESISRLARRFGLSRSTLLYYARIGLLTPSARSDAGHRRYDAEAARQLERIRLYRSAGLPLTEIRQVLDGPRRGVAGALERRLLALSTEMARLRAQQDVIVRLLGHTAASRRHRSLDRAGWTALLRAVGLDDDAMWRWHAEFERAAPEAHQELLDAIRIPRAEALRIRSLARERHRSRRGGSPAQPCER